MFYSYFCSIHWRRMTVTYHIQPRSRPHSFPVSTLHPSATVYKSVRRVSRKLEFLILILNSKCNCSIFMESLPVASRLKCTSSDPLFHFPSVAASYTNTPHFFFCFPNTSSHRAKTHGSSLASRPVVLHPIAPLIRNTFYILPSLLL